jgi:CheY-like chemotaxis protein
VLLVDDDDLVRCSVQALLEALGHGVTVAASGEEALALASFEPDVVILDLNMPGLGGGGTLPRLRALHPEVPILLATGRTDQTALDLVEAYRHVTLLAKPFGLQELRRQLDLIQDGVSPR